MSLPKMAFRLALVSALMVSSTSGAEEAKPNGDMAATLDRIRDAGLQDDWAYRRLADLCDKIGPRISGSRQAEAAVEQIAAALRAGGLAVTLQPVKVPHWVRGEEQAEIIDYPGHPAGVTQHLALTTLGGSTATPPEGVSGQVLVVHSFDELSAHEAEASGKIVLFDVLSMKTSLSMAGREVLTGRRWSIACKVPSPPLARAQPPL
jgi:carboxypeptidase Q